MTAPAPKPIDLRATLGQFVAEMDAVDAPELDSAAALLAEDGTRDGWRHDALQVVGGWIRKRSSPAYGYFDRLGALAARPCNCRGL